MTRYVSIHARHCWRANRCGQVFCDALHAFQSTPAIAGGRIVATMAQPRTMSSFQSTPAIAGGRIVWLGVACFPVFVSIHARHCWRANRSRWRPSPANPSSFNPRPPLLAGESRISRESEMASACFNPRPPLLAGESPVPSAPAPATFCFNPRPPLLAGESFILNVDRPPGAVSIHARHCWRANLFSVRSVGRLGQFQSTPAIAGGRIASHVTPCPLTIFSCTCANITCGVVFLQKITMRIQKNLFRTRACESREPARESSITRGSRLSP